MSPLNYYFSTLKTQNRTYLKKNFNIILPTQ